MRELRYWAESGKDQSGFGEVQANAVMLKIRKQAEPSVLYAGTEIFFWISVENVADIALERVVFRDVLELTIPFVVGSVMINKRPAALADPNHGIGLGTLDASASVEISFRAIAQAGPPLVSSTATAMYTTKFDRSKMYTAMSNAFYFRRFRHDFSRSSSGLVDAITSSQATLAQMMNLWRDAAQPTAMMAEATAQQAEKIDKTERQMANSMRRLAKLMDDKITFAKCHLTGYNNRSE